MNVISRQRIYEFVEDHKDADSSLTAWYKLASKAAWKHLADVKADYPGADLYQVAVKREVTYNPGHQW